MVQRYELKEDCVTGHIDLEEDTDGGWVRYEDYVKLEAAVIALLMDINRRYPGEGFKCPLILKLAEIVEHDGKESAWTVWLRGGNPVPGRLVDVKFRNGNVAYRNDSGIYRWWLCNGERDSDIIAYRVVG